MVIDVSSLTCEVRRTDRLCLRSPRTLKAMTFYIYVGDYSEICTGTLTTKPGISHGSNG